MRASVLLVLLSSLALVSSLLTHSFCGSGLSLTMTNEQAVSPPAPVTIYYVLGSVCLTFTNATAFVLDVTGTVKDQYNPAPYEVQAHCVGDYFFGSDYQLNLGYPAGAPTFCSQNTGLPGFCPWACTQFGGSWTAFFAPPLSGPMLMTINPSSANPKLNWGGLVQSFPMACNTTSCGSASDIIPPAPIPEGAVRRVTIVGSHE